jgi:hypothetical protein
LEWLGIEQLVPETRGDNMHLTRSRFSRTVIFLAAISLFGAACNDTSGPSYALGNVEAVVTEGTTPVSGVQMNLMLTDKATLWRTAITGSDGKAQFGAGEGGVIIQDYLVFFPSNVQYTLAPGETNYKPVKAVENQTATVPMKVAKVIVNPG